MSRLRVNLGSAMELAETLAATEKDIKRARKNALRRTATAVRRTVAADIAGATGLNSRLVRSKIVIYNPGGRYDDARIVPSSSGLPATSYPHRIVPIPGNPTRAHVFVRWFGGEKLAAGFANPLGAKQMARSTRNKTGEAMGPSVAAAMRLVVTEPLLADAREILAKNFEDSLFKQVDKDAEGD
jgi:hypothetical protein